jgi:hypothetical protein
MRKGQAALEFLMTYGWAILAVIVAIAALAYFTGTHQKFLPSVCTVRAPFSCVEYGVTTVGANSIVTLGIQNTAGMDMQSLNFTLHCNDDATIRRTYAQTVLRSHDKLNTTLMRFSCPSTGTVFKGAYSIKYTYNGESVSHNVTGNFRVSVD